jgi:hypothetical protein
MPVDFFLIGKMVLTVLALGLASILLILALMSFKFQEGLIESEKFIRQDIKNAYNLGSFTGSLVFNNLVPPKNKSNLFSYKNLKTLINAYKDFRDIIKKVR